MNLEAIRKTLLMTRSEAGRLLGATPDYPKGVSETTWNRWEAGKKPLPADVKLHIQRTINARNAQLLPQILQLSNGGAVLPILEKSCPEGMSLLDWHISQSIAVIIISLNTEADNG